MSRVIARLQMRTRPLLFTLLCCLDRRRGDDTPMPVRKMNAENERWMWLTLITSRPLFFSAGAYIREPVLMAVLLSVVSGLKKSGSSARPPPSASWTGSRHIRPPFCSASVCGLLPKWNHEMTYNNVRKMDAVEDDVGYLSGFYSRLLQQTTHPRPLYLITAVHCFISDFSLSLS